MQRRAFGGGDDISRGAGARGFRDLDLVARVGRLGDAVERFQRLGKGALLEIAAGDRDAQTVETAVEQRRHRLDGALVAHAGSSASGPCMAS